METKLKHGDNFNITAIVKMRDRGKLYSTTFQVEEMLIDHNYYNEDSGFLPKYSSDGSGTITIKFSKIIRRRNTNGNHQPT